MAIPLKMLDSIPCFGVIEVMLECRFVVVHLDLLAYDELDNRNREWVPVVHPDLLTYRPSSLSYPSWSSFSYRQLEQGRLGWRLNPLSRGCKVIKICQCFIKHASRVKTRIFARTIFARTRICGLQHTQNPSKCSSLWCRLWKLNQHSRARMLGDSHLK